MIKTENFTINEKQFIRTYSDTGRYVVRDGISYSEACDPAEYGRTYTEGDLIPDTDTDAEEILDIILGGAE